MAGNPEIAAGDPLGSSRPGRLRTYPPTPHPAAPSAYQFGRTFPIGQDWSDAGGLSFWYYGQGSGKNVQVGLANNQMAQTNPAKWKLIWSDEFNTKAGVAPNAQVWGNEIGDGTANGIPAGATTNWSTTRRAARTRRPTAQGNLVITTAGRMARCCATTDRASTRRPAFSRRTVSRSRTVGSRRASRSRAAPACGPPSGCSGTDIDQVGWPATGEIDIMEYVGRLPNQVFGTIHGPGYSGGQSYGNERTTWASRSRMPSTPMRSNGSRTRSSGSSTACPTSPPPRRPFLQGKQWVFNHPFFVLLNVAVGGNFGGAVDPDTVFPAETRVDYVRLYQAKPVEPSTSPLRRFLYGWQKVALPFSAFRRHRRLAPDLTRISSIAFLVPGGMRKPVMLDQIRLTCKTRSPLRARPTAARARSVRRLGASASEARSTSRPNWPARPSRCLRPARPSVRTSPLTAAAAPGLVCQRRRRGPRVHREPSATVTVKNLILKNGYGWQLAGGVLNNGKLTLDHVVVTANTRRLTRATTGRAAAASTTATAPYLEARGQHRVEQPCCAGPAAAFTPSSTPRPRSSAARSAATCPTTLAAGIRSLGNMTIANSTISGNTATGWHGGAIFQTDGDVAIANSTIANNIGPDWAPSTLFVGQFGGSFVPTLTLTNTHHHGQPLVRLRTLCLRHGSHRGLGRPQPRAGRLLRRRWPATSSTAKANIGPLADNGGPTQTHALLAGSPAIDAGDDAACPAVDQRGVARPQGSHCDTGSVEQQ